MLYVAHLNSSSTPSTSNSFSSIAFDTNHIASLQNNTLIMNQNGSLSITISGNGNVSNINAAIQINGNSVLSVSGTSVNKSKTIDVFKGDKISGSCNFGSYGGYMNNTVTIYYRF